MINFYDPQNEYTSYKKAIEKNFSKESLQVYCVYNKGSIKNLVDQIKKTATKEENILILVKIPYLKTKGTTESHNPTLILEKFCKILANKKYKINLIKAGELLEDKDTYINKSFEKIQKEETLINGGYHKYHYLISKKDFTRAVQKIVEKEVSGYSFVISLNKLLEEDLIRKLKQKYNFEIREQNEKSFISNEKIIGKKSNNILNFKPDVTLQEYIKNLPDIKYKKEESLPQKTIEKSVEAVSNKPSRERAFNVNKVLMPLLITAVLGILLFLFDFSFTNYRLYKNLKNSDYKKALIHSEKLKSVYLPTKWGENYNYMYNLIFYTLSALETGQSISINTADIEKVETLTDLSSKASYYANKVDKNEFITSLEKKEYEKHSGLFKANLGNHTSLLNILPLLKEEQKTLVLIQNSNELRPTGGFVGSYALVNTKNYKITNYKLDDIYNIDGTLKEEHQDLLISVPEEYKEFLNTEVLYARDLNLLIDTEKRNKFSKLYFEAALNTEIDNIVYVSLDSLKRILDITGPIYLAAYDVEVTSENFDVLAQTFAEKNYYEGSTQKKNFLNLLGAKVFRKFKEREFEITNLIHNASNSLEKKEVLAFSSNEKVQKYLEYNKLDYNIYNPYPNKPFLHILETNLGENKVNKKTNKAVTYNYKYDFRRGLEINSITIEIKNEANTYTWPYGKYKGLLHVFLPQNINVTGIKFKKGEQDINIIKSTDIEKHNNLSLLRLPFVIDIEEEASFNILYEKEVPEINKDKFEIYIQKQPGSKEYDLKLNVNIPDYLEKQETVRIDRDKNIRIADGK